MEKPTFRPKELKKLLEEHSLGHERKRELKRASQLRKAAREDDGARVRIRAAHWEEYDEEDIAAAPARRRASIHDFEAPREEDTGGGDACEGVVVHPDRGICQVRIGREDRACPTRVEVAPGDEVDVSCGVVRAVRPRRTSLSRPDPGNGNRERVIAANMDVVVVVAPGDAFKPGLVDRYLIAIQRGGAEPLLCVNKCDLGDPGDALAPYAALGVTLVRCSALTGMGIGGLRAALRGKSCVLVGHSGVGKSSLINALDPLLSLRTGAVRAGDGKGRHTTRGSTLYEIAGGIRVIDTPGIRAFGVGDLSAAELAWYFPEFAAADCRFRDCTHLHEPGCAVRQMPRYESYRRIALSR